MGYSERFIYCENEKDTKKFLNFLLNHIELDDPYRVYATLTFKKNFNLRYRNAIGMQIGEKRIPFTFNTMIEILNKEDFYRVSQDDGKELDEEKVANGQVGAYYDAEQEHLFNKNDTLIWVAGQRGTIKDAYSLFGWDILAVELMLEIKKAGELPEEFMVDGKIDIVKALPVFEGAVAKTLLTPDELELFEKVKFMDLDGIPNVDEKIKDTGMFRTKRL